MPSLTATWDPDARAGPAGVSATGPEPEDPPAPTGPPGAELPSLPETCPRPLVDPGSPGPCAPGDVPAGARPSDPAVPPPPVDVRGTVVPQAARHAADTRTSAALRKVPAEVLIG